MSSTISSVTVLGTYSYEELGAYMLVPTRIAVACEVPEGVRSVELSALALPFGLIERIRIISSDVDFTCNLEIVKTTGRTKTDSLTSGTDVCMVFNDSKNNEDAAHEDLKTTKAKTGHLMNCRMIAAATVVRVLLAFTSPQVPRRFTVEYDGANILTKENAAAGGPAYAFQLPPLTARGRMARNKHILAPGVPSVVAAGAKDRPTSTQ